MFCILVDASNPYVWNSFVASNPGASNSFHHVKLQQSILLWKTLQWWSVSRQIHCKKSYLAEWPLSVSDSTANFEQDFACSRKYFINHDYSPNNNSLCFVQPKSD